MRDKVINLLAELCRLHASGDRLAKCGEVVALLDERFMEWGDPPEVPNFGMALYPDDPPPVPRPVIRSMKYACGASVRGPSHMPLPVACPIHGADCKEAKKGRASFEP